MLLSWSACANWPVQRAVIFAFGRTWLHSPRSLSSGRRLVRNRAGGERGIWATGGGSSITPTGAAISVPTSQGAFGVLADSDGTIVLDGGSVSTGGDGSIGIRVTGAGSSIPATHRVTVATTATNATGVDASSGGMVSLAAPPLRLQAARPRVSALPRARLPRPM